VVDNISGGLKYRNLVTCDFLDYYDKLDFIMHLKTGVYLNEKIDAIIHLGACSSTIESNGRYIMNNNYEYSKNLLNYCIYNKIRFIYASSAAVYGSALHFDECSNNEMPLNIYGYSKLLFDRYVQKLLYKSKCQVIGLRYFNVYGPCENHKGSMASTIFQFNEQLLKNGKIKLFGGYNGYSDGEHRRDFVYITDAVNVILWFLENAKHCGIYNVGTGKSCTFNEVANAVLAYHGGGQIEYQDYPDYLRGYYQCFTEADIRKLRKAGYEDKFIMLQDGVTMYLDWLNECGRKY